MDEEKLKRDHLLTLYKGCNITLEELLEGFADTGLSPGLINDDFGNWALVFEGFQNVPEEPGTPSFIDTHFLIDSHKWHKTIRDAVIHSFDEPPEEKQKTTEDVLP